jgi:Fe2+ or Zn2+ uptake regulation protein
MCKHSGYFSGTTRYDHTDRVMRFVVTCDDCGKVIRVIHTEAYNPTFDPDGNKPYLAQPQTG